MTSIKLEGESVTLLHLFLSVVVSIILLLLSLLNLQQNSFKNMSSETYLTPGQRIKPVVDEKSIRKLIQHLYGLQVKSIEELNAYDDKNYKVLCYEKFENPHITNVEKDGYVLKIMNSLSSKRNNILEAQTEAFLFLNQNGIVCPLPVKQKTGSYFSLERLDQEEILLDCHKKRQQVPNVMPDSTNSSKRDKIQKKCTSMIELETAAPASGVTDAIKKKYAVLLLVYRVGDLLHKAPINEETMVSVGHHVAKLDQVLMGFSHPAYEKHETIWMLTSVPRLREFSFAVEDKAQRDLVHRVIFAFENQVLKIIEQLDKGIIHGDLNEQNIIYDHNEKKISAIIDFGDMNRSCLVFELAIAMCYMILVAQDIRIGKFVLQGYEELRPLTQLEKTILKICVCARLCQSLTLGFYSYNLNPQNDYLLSTQKSGWKILNELWPMSNDEVSQIWQL